MTIEIYLSSTLLIEIKMRDLSRDSYWKSQGKESLATCISKKWPKMHFEENIMAKSMSTF